jgi:transcriptional regulator with XRE-family HTH domain
MSQLLIDRLRKDFESEDSRYAYADNLVNTFVSAQIKALRERGNLSQEELAELIGTKQSGISRLERADYSAWKIETLRRLARAFGVRVRISFDEFGSLLADISGFSKEKLTPRKFEDDLVFGRQRQEPALEPKEAAANAITAAPLQWPAGVGMSGNIPDLFSRLAPAEKALPLGDEYPGLRNLTLQEMSGMGNQLQLPAAQVQADDPYRGLRLVPQGAIPQPSSSGTQADIRRKTPFLLKYVVNGRKRA